MHIVGGEIGTIVEFHAITKIKSIGFAVRSDVPFVGQVRDNRLPIAGVTADQIIIHRSLRRHIGDGSRLMHIEMRRGAQDAVTQGASPFGIGLGGLELKL